ncbi:hypothetical protein EC912_102487 [Luteibacter rhizovicinus]|uniref:EcsC family protein n=1 Tax=Luteibacter rhizovicinus TaxID=242606 RepID=A0A4R3YT85_9GAMM|nr:hypothetical protein [Luteibacter rhizovicinus]TCV96137.1 hypothetical protein EC912_102487 [Luteibacter rhizovicinus]
MGNDKETSGSREIVPARAMHEESPVARAILEFVSRIPASEVPAAGHANAEEACRKIASSAAHRAGLTAGSLALPPGPLGWLTVLPELVAIWRIQGQMVSDIAAAYGKTAKLGREQMLWCLFRHTAAQAFRDVAIRVGDRLIFRTTATSVLQRLAQRIGVGVSKRAVGKGISRWLPIVGALGVGAYAYYDTGQVAKTAIDLFSGDIHVEDSDGEAPVPAKKPRRAAAGTKKATVRKIAAKKTTVKTAKPAPAKTGTKARKVAVKKTASRKTATKTTKGGK